MGSSIFSQRFNSAIKQKGISPAELSRLAGVSEGVISQYRSGKYEPKRDRIEIFSRILAVPSSWLMGYDEEMHMEEVGLSKQDAIDSLLEMYECRGMETRSRMMGMALRNMSLHQLNDLKQTFHELELDRAAYSNREVYDAAELLASRIKEAINQAIGNLDEMLYAAVREGQERALQETTFLDIFDDADKSQHLKAEEFDNANELNENSGDSDADMQYNIYEVLNGQTTQGE